MSKTTELLQLTKPELSDPINPDVFAENFEKIDNAYMNIIDKINKQSISTDTKMKDAEKKISEIKNSMSRYKVVFTASVVATFTDGIYRFPFSYVHISSRPPCIVLTPSSANTIFMQYDWDASSSEIVIVAKKFDGSNLEGLLRFSILVSVYS